MLEKGKISTIQLEFIMIPTIVATGILSIPSIAGKFARHDMWMTPIIGSIIGFITVYIVWKLHQLFPKLTPIEYSEKILGKVFGMVFSLFLVCFYIDNTATVVRQYGNFISGNVMFDTPSIVFTIGIMFVSALAVCGGIEVIARSAVICTTIYMSTSLFLLLLIKDIDIGFMLPILENGMLPVIKGGLVHSAWFSEFFLLSFIFPFLHHPKKGLKAGMKASLYVMLIFTYVNFFVLTLLGVSSVNQFYPVYTIIRAISVMGFFENFEIVFTASWVLGNFVKISIFLYVASLGLAQVFRLSSYRIVVFPLSLLLVLISYWDIPNMVVLVDYLTRIQPFYSILVQTVLPLFLLIIALARRKRSGST
ncbi:spore germination protein KB [Bacillus sp. OK048]|nr:spore germination protein KB [Bacillus sp. OK048]